MTTHFIVLLMHSVTMVNVCITIVSVPPFAPQVTVEASDSGSPSLSAQVTITVAVVDVDDNLPQFEVY